MNIARSLPVLLLLAPAAAAQTVFGGARTSLPFPAGLSAPFTSTAACDLDGDGWQDVLQLHGGEASLAFAPAELVAIVPLGIAVDDVDVLPAAKAGERDAFVCATPDGVVLVTVDEEDGALGIDPLPGSTTSARLVAVADVLPSPGVEVIAFEPPKTLRVLGASGGVLATLAASQPVVDLLGLRWKDGTSEQQLAVLGESTLEVIDVSAPAAPLFAWGALGPQGILARVGERASALDRLAWVTPSPKAGEQWLLVLGSEDPAEGLDLGLLGVVATTTADYDLDGYDDLLTAHTWSQDLFGLVNARKAPGDPSFPGTLEQLLSFPYGPPATPAPLATAHPLFRDLDRDGDPDVWLAVEETKSFELLLGETVDQDGLRPVLVGSPVFEDLPGNASVLHLELEPGEGAAGAQRIEAELWSQPSTVAPFETRGLGVVGAPYEGEPVALDVPIPRSGTEWPDVFALRIHVVDAGQDPLPGTLLSFTMRGDVLDELTEGGALPFVPVSYLSAESPQVGTGGRGRPTPIRVRLEGNPAGGLVERPNIGPFGGGPPSQ